MAASVHPARFDEIHEAFRRYPEPLALAGEGTGIVQANEAWWALFGAARLMPLDPEEAPAGDDGWHPARLRLTGTGETKPVVARRIGPDGRVVLAAAPPGMAAQDGVIEGLQGRVAELERLAATDHLTGAWNRAHFERTIAAELERCRAGRLPVSLVLVDIDHFKRVNDTHGHAAGDAVLRELVAVMRTRIRASDLLFRWGGEEFAVLVSGAGWRGAERVAENLRQAVAGHDFPVAGRVTVSAGAAEHDGEESLPAWFGRLDAALYAAKAAGRDRVLADRRGSSDAWAREAGRSALHLAWQEAYECGEATIDDEHRELFALANRAIDATLGGGGREGVLAALDGLIAHVARHFADEEAILARLRYGDLEPHRRAHEGLVRRALWLRERVGSGEAGMGALVEFLAQDVVARHMLTMDRAFFPLFERRAG
ncbi:MAG: diguanylate cyclase [Burkholderiales bacterium]|nr:diguanylate cyclase [Burkholderiales bacterium]